MEVVEWGGGGGGGELCSRGVDVVGGWMFDDEKFLMGWQ